MKDSSKPKLVIFDFDGTLADSFGVFTSALQAAIERFHLREVTESDVALLRRMGAREIIAFLGISPWRIPQISRFVHSHMIERLSEIALFPGTESVLTDLRQGGVLIAIVSSNSEQNVRRILGPTLTGMVNVFDCGASLFGKARRFRRVVRRLGISSDAVIAIGDEVRDAEAAAESNIAFGAVAWGYTHPSAFQRFPASRIFTEVSDLRSMSLVSGFTNGSEG